MTTIADYMTKDIVSISSDSGLLEAVASMRESSIGSLLIKEGDSTIGIFTERDLLTRVDFNVSRDLSSIKVKDVMTKDLKIVDHSEMYTNVIETMEKYNIRHMPVVKDGQIIGIVSLRDLLNHYHENLVHLLEETVAALSSAAEKRDPYTAGHQKRVTKLACAIARELKLPESQIGGVRMAAIIHDIGKLYIPAEILNKPGPLSEAEFTLIKIHPQVSFDILKPIEFPWPIAQIVIQHHERLNGSGYPRGLMGEEILFEARILGVADVVEATASHRPYRPALGINKAMDEISKNKGVLYDPVVADACLRLFKEKGFKFS